MKKYGLLLVGILLTLAALAGREWLLTEEISVTQNQVREQVTATIQTAQNTERLRYISTSALVYERYLEPVFEITSRLLWSPLRSNLMTDWKREVHAKIDDLTAARLSALSGETEKQISKVKTDERPSVNRLMEILKLSEAAALQTSCTQTVQDEMKLVKEAGQKHDQEVLANLKAEGITQVKHLQKQIKGMTAAQMADFFKSGRFSREIQQPVLDYIFQIKQEELRRSAWDEFERKISSLLGKKGFPIAKVKDRSSRAKNEIEKLFNSMAEAKTIDLPAIPPPEPQGQSKLILPEPKIQSPSDSGSASDETTELQSPADADAD